MWNTASLSDIIKCINTLTISRQPSYPKNLLHYKEDYTSKIVDIWEGIFLQLDVASIDRLQYVSKLYYNMIKQNQSCQHRLICNSALKMTSKITNRILKIYVLNQIAITMSQCATKDAVKSTFMYAKKNARLLTRENDRHEALKDILVSQLQSHNRDDAEQTLIEIKNNVPHIQDLSYKMSFLEDIINLELLLKNNDVPKIQNIYDTNAELQNVCNAKERIRRITVLEIKICALLHLTKITIIDTQPLV